MKRVDLIRHLERHGCYLDREGANHTIYRKRGQRPLRRDPQAS